MYLISHLPSIYGLHKFLIFRANTKLLMNILKLRLKSRSRGQIITHTALDTRYYVMYMIMIASTYIKLQLIISFASRNQVPSRRQIENDKSNHNVALNVKSMKLLHRFSDNQRRYKQLLRRHKGGKITALSQMPLYVSLWNRDTQQHLKLPAI